MSVSAVSMSYDLTKYRTFTHHGAQCGDCTKLMHPAPIHVPQLEEELRKNRMKRRTTETKVRSISLLVADLERKVRDATREGRVDYKYQLTFRLSIQDGFLHMMLRYACLLKQDNRRLKYYLQFQAGRAGPLPTLNFKDAIELNMETSAPDVGALLMYDFYSPNTVLEEEEDRIEGVEEVDSEDQEPFEEYSIITELYAALSSS